MLYKAVCMFFVMFLWLVDASEVNATMHIIRAICRPWKTYKALNKKYKAYILKYVPYVLK